MAQQSSSTFLSESEAADYLGVSKKTLQLHPQTTKIEEESPYIQPAPCFGRSLAG